MNIEIDPITHEALLIINQLEKPVVEILIDVSRRMKLSPLEYLVKELQTITVAQKYCEKEGLRYSDYREKIFMKKINAIEKQLKAVSD